MERIKQSKSKLHHTTRLLKDGIKRLTTDKLLTRLDKNNEGSERSKLNKQIRIKKGNRMIEHLDL